MFSSFSVNVQSLNAKTNTRLRPIPEALKNNKFIYFAFLTLFNISFEHWLCGQSNYIDGKGEIRLFLHSKSIDLQILEASTHIFRKVKEEAAAEFFVQS